MPKEEKKIKEKKKLNSLIILQILHTVLRLEAGHFPSACRRKNGIDYSLFCLAAAR